MYMLNSSSLSKPGWIPMLMQHRKREYFLLVQAYSAFFALMASQLARLQRMVTARTSSASSSVT